MARSDLIIALVKAGTAGNKGAVRTAAEAIIAEEKAKQHNVISYADVEQFCLDVRRSQVLSLGEKSLKAIVSEQLVIWSSRARGSTFAEEGIGDGQAPATNTSHT